MISGLYHERARDKLDLEDKNGCTSFEKEHLIKNQQQNAQPLYQ